MDSPQLNTICRSAHGKCRTNREKRDGLNWSRTCFVFLFKNNRKFGWKIQNSPREPKLIRPFLWMFSFTILRHRWFIAQAPRTVDIQQCHRSNICVNVNRDIRVGVSSEIRSTAAPSRQIEWRFVAVARQRGYRSSRWPARKPFPGHTDVQRTLLTTWHWCLILHNQRCANGKWELLRMSQTTAGGYWGQIDARSMRTKVLKGGGECIIFLSRRHKSAYLNVQPQRNKLETPRRSR